MTRILLAGDHFVRNDLIRDALDRHFGPDRFDLTEIQLPWPREPFHPVAEVVEASGAEDDLVAALSQADVCLTQMAPLTRRVLAASPALKLVCVGRGGPVNVNLVAATEAGVTVTSAPGRNSTATAEHTVALIMASLRAIPRRDAELRDGQWRSDYYQYDEVGPEIAGSTVGVVGYGAIGRRVATILRGLGAEVLVFDPFADASSVAAVAKPVNTLDDLLRQSLIVTLHARATPDTEGLIGRSEIDAMPPGGFLINASRGSLVDYDAVCDALHSGHLRGAGFDVFPDEPIPADSPLLTQPNAVMTPHVAGASKQSATNAVSMMVDEVRRYLDGLPPLNPA